MSRTTYCTLNELKTALNISLSDTTWDGDLNASLYSAADWIDRETNRRFYPDADANQVRNYWPENSGYCIIDDCCTFTSLVSQNTTWVLDQDFFLLPLNAAAQGEPFTAIKTIARPFLFTKADVPSGWNVLDGRVQVTGKFGWASAPNDIHDANLMKAQRIFKRKREAPAGLEVTAGPDVRHRLGASDPDIEDLISPYRLTWFA